ncbi:MAG: cytochrome c biogenesis protein CcdA [Spirochaetaceae bacterium]|nr:MAG: cytochrome c biogenesis protein CcdA [Spirochaetaceae bacterium]
MTDINVFIAFAAGLLSFLSPCVLPLLPSYISYVGGVSLDELQDAHADRTVLFLRTLMFVLGFSLVFVVLGILFSGSVALIGGTGRVINLIAGGIVIVLGLNVMFDFMSLLNRERRVHVKAAPGGYLGSAAVGMAFGAGWTPCIGPVLAGILFLAGSSASVSTGMIYLLAYSFGLGLPFLVASLAFAPLLEKLRLIKPYLGTIKSITGGVLILIGVLIASGQFQQLQATLFRAGLAIERWSQQSPATARSVLSGLTLLIALIPFARPVIRRMRGNREVRILGPIRLIITLVLLLIAGLNLTGALSLHEAIVAWFMYEGL